MTGTAWPGNAARPNVPGEPTEPHRPWTVLLVCTGNLCRSPLAEHLAAVHFSAVAAAPVFHSAGLLAKRATPMHPHAAALLHGRGVDPTAFRTRPLTEKLVDASDLILGAAREHRSAVVALAPRALRRTFTVREFGRLTSGVRLADLPPGEPRLAGEYLTAAAWRARGAGHAVPASSDNLTDPLEGGREAFEACVRMIDEALSGPMALLARASLVQPAGRASAAG
ncbi:protein-tyrosine-phosphatase [Frankia gtarii]|uniref:arsenate reductase/protein-tyrosine-phosphatase family protein n=1 Tax=Frankia gtarii TaxID=2950102 RepID=UPI0021BF7F80|nr:protein-tyrosine-phosphatase [Frankia gtarii]